MTRDFSKAERNDRETRGKEGEGRLQEAAERLAVSPSTKRAARPTARRPPTLLAKRIRAHASLGINGVVARRQYAVPCSAAVSVVASVGR